MVNNEPSAFIAGSSGDPQKDAKLLTAIAQIVQEQRKPRGHFDHRLKSLLQIILDYLGVAHGSIMVLEKGKLVVRAATRKGLVGEKLSLNADSVAAWVARHKEAVFVPDISKDPRFPQSGANVYQKNSLLSVPIIHGSQLLGVINATDRLGETDLLQEDVTYLLDFSSLMISTLVQRRLNDRLKRQKATLRRRNTQLKHQERLQDELNSMIIHDLKAPLAEVIANLDILSYSVSGESRPFLEAAQVGCDKTVRMVENLVSISKMEDSKLEPFLEEADTASLLEESASSLKSLAKIKEINFDITTTPDTPQAIYLDRVLTLRILQNLLVNAINHSPTRATITLGGRPGPRGRSL